MTDRKCPLGEDCDLTVAWMAGQQEARDSFRARINQIEVQLGLSRTEADAQRARAEAAEDRSRELSHKLDELDFLRHEGGPQSVAAMEETLRDVVLPELRHTAEDLFRCVSVRNDPASISGQDWRDIAPAMEAVLSVERFVGRPDDDYGRVLNPVLDAASWRAHQ